MLSIVVLRRATSDGRHATGAGGLRPFAEGACVLRHAMGDMRRATCDGGFSPRPSRRGDIRWAPCNNIRLSCYGLSWNGRG